MDDIQYIDPNDDWYIADDDRVDSQTSEESDGRHPAVQQQ